MLISYNNLLTHKKGTTALPAGPPRGEAGAAHRAANCFSSSFRRRRQPCGNALSTDWRPRGAMVTNAVFMAPNILAPGDSGTFEAQTTAILNASKLKLKKLWMRVDKNTVQGHTWLPTELSYQADLSRKHSVLCGRWHPSQSTQQWKTWCWVWIIL